MSRLKIYFDEDATDADLIAALRSRGVKVVTPLDGGLIGNPDEAQLVFAMNRECVLYTFNVSDSLGAFGGSPRVIDWHAQQDDDQARPGVIRFIHQ